MLHALVENAMRLPQEQRLTRITDCEVIHDRGDGPSRMEMTVMFREPIHYP